MKEAPSDLRDNLEYEVKWALRGRRGTKELLEIRGRGVRKDTEDSPGFKACQEQL